MVKTNKLGLARRCFLAGAFAFGLINMGGCSNLVDYRGADGCIHRYDPDNGDRWVNCGDGWRYLGKPKEQEQMERNALNSLTQGLGTAIFMQGLHDN